MAPLVPSDPYENSANKQLIDVYQAAGVGVIAVEELPCELNPNEVCGLGRCAGRGRRGWCWPDVISARAQTLALAFGAARCGIRDRSQFKTLMTDLPALATSLAPPPRPSVSIWILRERAVFFPRVLAGNT
jgi:hypothetical protein